MWQHVNLSVVSLGTCRQYSLVVDEDQTKQTNKQSPVLSLPQNTTVEKSKAKLTQVTESHEVEKREAQERREAEVEELQQQLQNTTRELTEQQDKTTAHKQLLDKITTEKDALQVGNV